MACINPDGTLSTVARALLELLETPHTVEDSASILNFPLFRIRASVRELQRATLIEPTSAGLIRTSLGSEALALDEEAAR